jgi:hypothetical protein
MKKLFFIACTLLFTIGATAKADSSVAGTYKTILLHEGTTFYQPALITLRTLNIGGSQLKISANVRVFFGDFNSTEFISYEYDDCPMNLLTRQISIKNEKNNVALVGFLKTGSFDGEWYSTSAGRVGKFTASKDTTPATPTGGILIKPLSGHYRGAITNTSPESNLPERATLSFVTTQDTSAPEAQMKISGNTRLYLGEFTSLEYVETKLMDIQFNFYNRYLTARTVDYGLTYKGYMSQDGVFEGTVFADGIGEAAKVKMQRYP